MSPTLLQSIANRKRSLEDLVRNLRGRSPIDPEATEAYAALIIIRSSGYIEFSFEKLLEHYSTKMSCPGIQRFIKSTHGRGSNPWPGTLENRLGSYSVEWKKRLASYLNDVSLDGIMENRKLLGQLIDHRNKVAHGDSSSASLMKVFIYADFALAFVEELDNIILDGVDRT